MKLKLLLILSILSISVFAQNNQHEAKVFTIEGDTLIGSIKFKNAPKNNRVDFVTNTGKKRLFFPKDLIGFEIEKSVYESCLVPPLSNLFIERIISGQISLYKYNSSYYLREGSGDLIKLNDITLWPIIKDKIKNHSTLVDSIERNNQKIDIEEIIKEYNLWYVKNNIVANKEYNNQINDVVNLESDSIIISSQKLFNVKVNLIGVGLETKITNQISVYCEAGSGIYFSMGTNGSNFEFYPYVFAQPRFYTNLKKREKYGKKTVSFSGSYISPYFIYLFRDEKILITDDRNVVSESLTNNAYGIGINLGIQRKVTKVFYWGYDIGFGLVNYYNTNYMEPQFLNKFKFGLSF